LLPFISVRVRLPFASSLLLSLFFLFSRWLFCRAPLNATTKRPILHMCVTSRTSCRFLSCHSSSPYFDASSLVSSRAWDSRFILLLVHLRIGISLSLLRVAFCGSSFATFSLLGPFREQRRALVFPLFSSFPQS